jgi:hypothetical protein
MGRWWAVDCCFGESAAYQYYRMQLRTLAVIAVGTVLPTVTVIAIILHITVPIAKGRISRRLYDT